MSYPKSDPRAVATATGVKVNGQADHHKDTSPLGLVHDALTLACGWGWPVLPVRPGAKLPATAHGFHDATTDPDTVLDWWADVPTYNVGIATGEVSGLVVLDVDPGGSATMADLIREHGPLPTTLAVRTPRGGLHGYYRHPGIRVPCSAGKLGTSVDVRADGGYVVAPPSTVDGTPYRWRDDPWPGPPALPALPEAWLELLTAKADPPTTPGNVPHVAGVDGRAARYAESAVRGELAEVAAAIEGTRNHRLNQAAYRLGTLAGAGALDPDAARDALTAAAALCGLGQREASRTIASGLAAGLAQPAELPGEVAA